MLDMSTISFLSNFFRSQKELFGLTSPNLSNVITYTIGSEVSTFMQVNHQGNHIPSVKENKQRT